MERRKSKCVYAGSVPIGGGAPVTVQSMLNVPSNQIGENAAQALELERAGCEIIRVAVPDMDAVRLVSVLKETVGVPIVADIHFDYRLALESAAAGVDKIRINPGNIGGEDKVQAVAKACREKKLPIRIGVNSGSLEKEILAKYGAPTAEALVESALYHASLLNRFDFDDIVLSMKSSSVPMMYEAYRLAAEKTEYPLHLGVTEAGTQWNGLIKSSAGIGGLLLSGVGDTVRVSLTDTPVKEVKAGLDLMRAVGCRSGGVQIVSCPSCGRTRIDLISLARRVEELLRDCQKNITVAIMGCVVNGPGEAREADIGICGGDQCGVIIKKGQVIRRAPEDRLLEEFMKEIEKL